MDIKNGHWKWSFYMYIGYPTSKKGLNGHYSECGRPVAKCVRRRKADGSWVCARCKLQSPHQDPQAYTYPLCTTSVYLVRQARKERVDLVEE